jgi:hypothetical protein
MEALIFLGYVLELPLIPLFFLMIVFGIVFKRNS